MAASALAAKRRRNVEGAPAEDGIEAAAGLSLAVSAGGWALMARP